MGKEKNNNEKIENIAENNEENKTVRKRRSRGSKELNNREKDILKFIEKQVK